MEQYPFVPELVINDDESPVDAMKAKPSKALVNANVKKHCTIDFPRESIRTILPFVSAAGSVWMGWSTFLRLSQRRTTQPFNLFISLLPQQKNVELGQLIMQQLIKVFSQKSYGRIS
jgi:hypothetical protein